MDPFTALGLAANICQFVDYGYKLVSGALELYNSLDGTLSANRILETIAKDLANLCAELEQAPLDSNNNSTSESEAALLPLARACKVMGQELLSVLEDLKVKGRHKKLESAWLAVRSRYKASQLRDYERTLGLYRAELATRLLKILT